MNPPPSSPRTPGQRRSPAIPVFIQPTAFSHLRPLLLPFFNWTVGMRSCLRITHKSIRSPERGRWGGSLQGSGALLPPVRVAGPAHSRSLRWILPPLLHICRLAATGAGVPPILGRRERLTKLVRNLWVILRLLRVRLQGGRRWCGATARNRLATLQPTHRLRPRYSDAQERIPTGPSRYEERKTGGVYDYAGQMLDSLTQSKLCSRKLSRMRDPALQVICS